MKPPLRTKSVGTKVSEAEFALLEEHVRGAEMRLAEWVRVRAGANGNYCTSTHVRVSVSYDGDAAFGESE